MSKHKEFLAKLAELMKEYDASFDVTYYESGCDCCGGDYEFEIRCSNKTSTLNGSYIYPYMIDDKVNE